jgi:NodT family efflux transporter outer membrane factor (OMF) lipoprotein
MKIDRTLILVTPFLVLLGGCMVGPDYQRPDIRVNDDWIDAEDQSVVQEELAFDEWWTVFEDPTLDTLVSTAYDQNLSLRIAGLRVLEARARRGIVAGVFFPQIQRISGGAAAVSISENDPNVSVLDRDFNSFGVGIDAVWELDFWGKYRRGIESADAALLATVTDYDAVLVGLIGEVAATYISVRMFEERLALAESNVELQTRTLKIAQVRFDNGAVTELDVAQAETNLSATKALVPVLKAGLRQSKITLGILLGMQPSTLDTILGEPGVIPTAPLELAVGVPADLLRRRPDVRSAEHLAASLSAQIGIAEANLLPSISLAGSTGFRTGDSFGTDGNVKDLGDLFDSDSAFGFVGLAVNWPILQYGRLKNNIRLRDARFQQALVNYENTVLRAAGEVENSLNGYINSTERADTLSSGVTASSRSVELSMTQYREGTIDFLRVLNAQTTLVTMQDQYASARSQVALSLVSTYKSLGGGWQIRNGEEFIPQQLQREMSERTDWGEIMNLDYSSGDDFGFDRPKDNANNEPDDSSK